MSWKDIHFDSTVVDLHNHACMKHSMFSRNLGTKKRSFCQVLWREQLGLLVKGILFPKWMTEGWMSSCLQIIFLR